MVINENRASVMKDATELLVRWSHYLCSGLHYICCMPTDIVLVVKSTFRRVKIFTGLQLIASLREQMYLYYYY